MTPSMFCPLGVASKSAEKLPACGANAVLPQGAAPVTQPRPELDPPDELPPELLPPPVVLPELPPATVDDPAPLLLLLLRPVLVPPLLLLPEPRPCRAAASGAAAARARADAR